MSPDNSFIDKSVPKTAVLELTYRCSHKCIFCSVPWSSPRNDYGSMPELSISEWMECIDELVRRGVRAIAFSGGEALLKEGFEEIFTYAASQKVQEPVFDWNDKYCGDIEKNMEISVITNGKAIDEKNAEFFSVFKPLLTVSLPGLETFQKHTGGGDYNEALNAIHLLSEKNMSVTVAICVTKKNLPELFQTISHGFLNGAVNLLLNRFLPGGRGLEHPELCLNSFDIETMLDVAEEVCLNANIHGTIGTELPRCILKKEYKMIHTGTQCSGGTGFFAVDPSGYLRPCNHSPVRLGTYKDIPGAITTDYWQKFKTKDFLPKQCFHCAMSLYCDGGCREAAHIMRGSLDAVDDVMDIKIPVIETKGYI